MGIRDLGQIYGWPEQVGPRGEENSRARRGRESLGPGGEVEPCCG